MFEIDIVWEQYTLILTVFSLIQCRCVSRWSCEASSEILGSDGKLES